MRCNLYTECFDKARPGINAQLRIFVFPEKIARYILEGNIISHKSISLLLLLFLPILLLVFLTISDSPSSALLTFVSSSVLVSVIFKVYFFMEIVFVTE